MSSSCRGDDEVNCNDQLDIALTPSVNIGTLLLLNKESEIFTGDLKIVTDNGFSSLIDIPFAGPIDINYPLVKTFEFTVLKYYRDNNLENNCNDKLRW